MSTQLRRDVPIPEDWKVRHGSSVQVLDSERLDPRDLPVRGRWRAIERTPWNGWWLQPADEQARWWLGAHGTRAGAQSGMIPVHGQRLVPGHLRLAGR